MTVESDKGRATRRREVILIALGSVLLLTITFVRPLWTPMLDSLIRPGEAGPGIAWVAFDALIPVLPTLGFFIAAWTLRLQDGLASALGRANGPFGFAVCGAMTMVVFWIFDRVSVLPWTWRWRTSGAIPLAVSLMRRDVWAGLALWMVVGCLIIPLVEEVLFRYWIQRGVLSATKSRVAAVLISSACFGAGHLGYPFWHPNYPAILNSLSNFLFGLVLGTLALNHTGGLRRTVGIHAGRNLIEFIAMVYTAARIG